ncbi:MAG: hypothetical protein NZ960_08290 [Candidatus Kapabacteria bacterium]|nr:hypothetical protein [Candidatus Kapabacteria bacterium]MDW8012453.1 hypothetical protein [Bacteroidota bacterium]
MRWWLPAVFGVILVLSADARTAREHYGAKEGDIPQPQRLAQGTFEQRRNRVSRIEFYTTNYGIFGLNIAANRGGGFWPRGSQNQYIFGGGIWFGAKKRVRGELRKLVIVSYNPNSGASWMVPGRVADGDEYNDELKDKYQLYFSTDYAPDGTPLPEQAGQRPQGPNWPLWITSERETLKVNRYFGDYIDDLTLRNLRTYPRGPAFISQEDIWCVFKDTDLRRYEGGVAVRRSQGYPLRVDIEQTIYSWGFGDYGDFIFLKYLIINRSQDTLYECWMAPAMDFDIGPAANPVAIAGNDRVRFYDEDPTLNLAIQWSNPDQGEAGKGFGYLGMTFLESPAVDPATGFIRKDRRFYPLSEQLGLVTFRNWVIENDPTGDEERYDFMAARIRDGDQGPGDKRFLMATGPFNMAPGDTARVVVGLILAATSTGRDATGFGDLDELVRKVRFAQAVYDGGFKAPIPPDRSNLSWSPLNNGVVIRWDSTAEYTYDDSERGLDFLGYRLYRARRLDLDSFDVDHRSAASRGPFGWKEIARWEVPNPFIKKSDRPLLPGSPYPRIDSLVFISQPDSFTVRVARVGFGGEPWGEFWQSLNAATRNRYLTGEVQISRALTGGRGLVRQSFPSTEEFLNALYDYIQQGKATLVFPDFDDDPVLRQQVRQTIARYIARITNNRTFVDVGDDDRSGTVDDNPDPARTERLFNNVDYYYRLLAYDEGDVIQRTPSKLNIGVTGVNVLQAFPRPAPASEPATITITSEDRDKLGGIYNFRFLVQDEQRLQQLFGGHELEVEFQPLWFGTRFFAPQGAVNGIYARQVILRDLTAGTELGRYVALFEPTQCQGTVVGLFSEFAGVFTGDTTQGIGRLDTVSYVQRTGTFRTDAVCNAPDQYIYGTLGFAFDYAVQQWAGQYRPYRAERRAGSDVDVPVYPDRTQVQLTQPDPATQRYVSFNNGPARYLVVLEPGGTETVTITWNSGRNSKQVQVPYYNVKVYNAASFERLDPVTGRPVQVSYPGELPRVDLTLSRGTGPDARQVPIGSYGFAAVPWVNGRSADGITQRRVQLGDWLPQQGRYYLSVISDGDTIDFVHVFVASGCRFLIDFANKRGWGVSPLSGVDRAPSQPTRDFRPGDTIVFETTGGALGFPLPGAKIRARVSQPSPPDKITDAILEQQVKVVPNPYYVVHQAQRSQYDAKIFFTRLPERCTIRIYTLSGELVRTLEYDARTAQEQGRLGVAVWDLLSDNLQRVASQAFVAHIETPNGAKAVLPFSVVVGGIRQVPE